VESCDLAPRFQVSVNAQPLGRALQDVMYHPNCRDQTRLCASDAELCESRECGDVQLLEDADNEEQCYAMLLRSSGAKGELPVSR